MNDAVLDHEDVHLVLVEDLAVTLTVRVVQRDDALIPTHEFSHVHRERSVRTGEQLAEGRQDGVSPFAPAGYDSGAWGVPDGVLGEQPPQRRHVAAAERVVPAADQCDVLLRAHDLPSQAADPSSRSGPTVVLTAPD